MTVKIYYKRTTSKKKPTNLVLFVDEKFNISSLKKHILSPEYIYISDVLKIKNSQKKIVSFEISSKRNIILISLKKNLSSSDAENLGAKFYEQFKDSKQLEYNVNSDTLNSHSKNLIGNFLHGIKLKSYKFEKYKTKKKKLIFL